jgi:DNA-binding MarR family transcriptional regulator
MRRTPPLRLERFVPYRLSVLTNIVSGAIASTYAERFALTIPEWRVVAVLAEEPGLSAAEVAARTAMDKVAVSRAVASLLRARRIERSRSNHDRRRSKLRLSRAGAAVYAEVVPAARAYERDLLAALDAEERDSLDRLLGKLTLRAVDLGPCIIARLAEEPR